MLRIERLCARLAFALKCAGASWQLPRDSTVGPLPSLAYDAHGNTTRLADQQLAYDVTDNHTTMLPLLHCPQSAHNSR